VEAGCTIGAALAQENACAKAGMLERRGCSITGRRMASALNSRPHARAAAFAQRPGTNPKALLN